MRNFTLAAAAALSAAILPANAATPVNDGSSIIRVGMDNIAIIEIESAAVTGDWVFENTDAGYAGTGYFRWNGPNYFNESQAGEGILAYFIEVLEGGNYLVKLHNRHDHPNDTEENDVWIRHNGGPWIKLFSNGPNTVAQWTWDSRFDLEAQGLGQPAASFDMEPGINRIEFSGRSTNFKMDRFHVFLPPNPDNTNLSAPPTVCRVGSWYCDPASLNSTGEWTRITASGSTTVTDQTLNLHAYNLPANSFGFFICSQTQGLIANPGGSDGDLCLGGQMNRFWSQIQNSGAGGSMTIEVDMQQLPAPYNGPILVGQTWNFTCWHRDGLDSNFANGISVDFQ